MTLPRSARLGLAAFGVVAIAGATWGAWHWADGRDTPADYRLARIERGPLVAAVSATGTLNPVSTVQVGSQLSGQVKEVRADFNTEVRKGQVIARIDPELFELRVKQAQADLQAAESAVAVAIETVKAREAEAAKARLAAEEAARDLARKKSLVERAFISGAELDKAGAAADQAREQARAAEAQIAMQRSQVENARAVVKQREATLSQARVDLERTYIRAPVDGTVISRTVDAGQTVAASLQAPTLFAIARDLREMQVETSVDEADVGRLRVGQAVTFAVDAFPRRSFEGKIVQIRKSPQVVQNVVTYTVVVTAANPDLALLPGMTANVRIVIASRDNVLKVPNAALRFRPPANDAGIARAAEVSPTPGGGPQAAQVFRERVLAELNLESAQKTSVDAVFAESRQRMASLREMQNDNERRKHAERLRLELRARIAEVLRPEQQAAYENLLAEFSGRSTSGHVWVLDEAGGLRAVDIRLGIADGSSTEIIAGDIQEGAQIVVGMAQGSKGARPSGGPAAGLLR
jgi:HlyD family secretion protein